MPSAQRIVGLGTVLVGLASGLEAQEGTPPEPAPGKSEPRELVVQVLPLEQDLDAVLLETLEGLVERDTPEGRARAAELGRWRERLRWTFHQSDLSRFGPESWQDERLEDLALDPSGTHLATAGEGLWIWDLETGRAPLGKLLAEEWVMHVAFDPTGTRLVAIGFKEAEDPRYTEAEEPVTSRESRGTGWVLDAGSGQVLQRFEMQEWRSKVAWAPDGEAFAVYEASDPPRVRGFRLGEPEALFEHTLTGRGGPSLAISPDGNWLAVAGRPTRLFNWPEGEPVDLLGLGFWGRLLWPCSDVVAFHSTRPELGMADSRAGFQVLDLGTRRFRCGRRGGTLGGGFDQLVHAPAQGAWIHGSMDTWYVHDEDGPGSRSMQRVLDDLEYHHAYDEIPPEAVSEAGRFAASGGTWDTVRVWDTATGERVEPVFSHGARATRLELHESGILVTGSEDGLVRVWDLVPGRAPAFGTEFQGTQRNRITLDESGRRAVWVAQEEVLRLVGPGVDRELEGRGRDDARSLDVTPDGRQVLVGSRNGRVWVHDLQGRVAEPQSVQLGTPFQGVAGTSHPLRLAMSGLHGVTTWEQASGDTGVTGTVPGEYISGVVWAPDGTLLVWGIEGLRRYRDRSRVAGPWLGYPLRAGTDGTVLWAPWGENEALWTRPGEEPRPLGGLIPEGANFDEDTRIAEGRLLVEVDGGAWLAAPAEEGAYAFLEDLEDETHWELVADRVLAWSSESGPGGIPRTHWRSFDANDGSVRAEGTFEGQVTQGQPVKVGGEAVFLLQRRVLRLLDTSTGSLLGEARPLLRTYDPDVHFSGEEFAWVEFASNRWLRIHLDDGHVDEVESRLVEDSHRSDPKPRWSTTHQGRTVTVWDDSTGEPVAFVRWPSTAPVPDEFGGPPHLEVPNALAVQPGGRYLALAGTDGRFGVVRLPGGEEVAHFMSPNGRTFPERSFWDPHYRIAPDGTCAYGWIRAWEGDEPPVAFLVDLRLEDVPAANAPGGAVPGTDNAHFCLSPTDSGWEVRYVYTRVPSSDPNLFQGGGQAAFLAGERDTWTSARMERGWPVFDVHPAPGTVEGEPAALLEAWARRLGRERGADGAWVLRR